jgi:hypothetical protein
MSIIWLGSGIILLGAVLLSGAVIAAGMFLSWPARVVIGLPPPELHTENVAISSASGATLHGWFVAGRPGGGAVVLMHGVRSNRLSMIRRARLLNAEGFSILLFDFQAHGESTGTRITFGHLEGMDASSAVAFVRHRLPAERVGAIGTSLGGAAALLGPEPLPVDALVLESVYPDIEAATANRIQMPLVPFLVRSLRRRWRGCSKRCCLPYWTSIRPGFVRSTILRKQGSRCSWRPVRATITPRLPRQPPCSIAPRTQRCFGRSPMPVMCILNPTRRTSIAATFCRSSSRRCSGCASRNVGAV